MSKDCAYHFRLFGYSIFLIYLDKRIGWFRLFGIGLSWKNIADHPLIFSGRMGYPKYFKIGNWAIKYLPKTTIKKNK